MRHRYRVASETRWGTVTVLTTDDLTEATDAASRKSGRGIYDNGNHEWLPAWPLRAWNALGPVEPLSGPSWWTETHPERAR